jgi:hypothetical protein
MTSTRHQVKALDRTQPGLPLKKGRAGTVTHDYKRHGTTTLFAALTHHAPHRRSVHEKYADSMLSAAFASDLTSTMGRGRPGVWIHGHTHLSCDYLVAATRVVSNPKGYRPKVWGEARARKYRVRRNVRDRCLRAV